MGRMLDILHSTPEHSDISSNTIYSTNVLDDARHAIPGMTAHHHTFFWMDCARGAKSGLNLKVAANEMLCGLRAGQFSKRKIVTELPTKGACSRPMYFYQRSERQWYACCGGRTTVCKAVTPTAFFPGVVTEDTGKTETDASGTLCVQTRAPGSWTLDGCFCYEGKEDCFNVGDYDKSAKFAENVFVLE
eukprot:GEMP01054810.1.p1 GENE.GEMP01054810.1~~GEMP01054810.1.p1  ORF type:complete len:189 (+),score=32.37 GEMP01054810.1:138-704(+)